MNIATLAFKGVDFSDDRTMSGIGVALKEVAPLLLVAQSLIEAADLAKERGQDILPTRVRLLLGLLRAEMRRWTLPAAASSKETSE